MKMKVFMSFNIIVEVFMSHENEVFTSFQMFITESAHNYNNDGHVSRQTSRREEDS
jgi:hypothetical protein